MYSALRDAAKLFSEVVIPVYITTVRLFDT